MKRILILSHCMELGGAERALLGLLEGLSPAEYQVDLFLLSHTGALLGHIPPYINLLPEIPAYASLLAPMASLPRQGQWRVLLGRLYGKWRAERRRRQLGITGEHGIALEYSHKYTAFAMPPISQVCYDMVISFLTPHYFAQCKAEGRYKVAWIHTDYAALPVDAASELAMWAAYDAIVSISPAVTEGFLQRFPSLKSKVVELENPLPVQAMIRWSQGDVSSELPPGAGPRLLSIGRFTYQKNFDQVPAICKALHQQGVPATWYLIGYGGDEALIRQRIHQAGMEEYVRILGKRDNPYPYLCACDLYVQPSRYEGKCVAVQEAQILGRPVAITGYPTASSQLEDGVDGVIVPQDVPGCAAGLAALLKDPQRMARLACNCRQRDYAHRSTVEALMGLMEHNPVPLGRERMEV